jgi:hypothetical protein
VSTALDSACYGFGIVPAGAPVPECDGSGLASGLRLVREADLAALVGSPPSGRSLGRASDLLAHDEALRRVVAARTPVLPMRFGAVLRDEAAVVDDLLHEHHEEFRQALDRVRDRVQFSVTVRYREDVVLREILAEEPELHRLRHDPTFAARLRLGERVVAALERRRPKERSALLAELGGFEEIRLAERAEPDVVLAAALLVRTGESAVLERRLAQLARRNASRLLVRLAGPNAPYDFVGTG